MSCLNEEIILISYTNISITGTDRVKPQLRVFLDEYKKQGKEFDNICCLYSTAPFVTAERLKEAYKKMIDENVDAVFTPIWYFLDSIFLEL